MSATVLDTPDITTQPLPPRYTAEDAALAEFQHHSRPFLRVLCHLALHEQYCALCATLTLYHLGYALW